MMKNNLFLLEPDFHNIPSSLKRLPWGVWKAEPREGQSGKYNKAPRNPLSGIKIGADKPEKFGTFDEAKSAYEKGKYSGVGVLLIGSGIVGIDIDDYPELFELRPEIKQWARQAVKEGAYCEKSPSGKGLRLFMLGTLPAEGRKSHGLEIYSDKRFLTVTGHVLRTKAGV